jgi:hypothetical protein
VLGRPFSGFVRPEDRDTDLEGFRRLASGEGPVHEVEKRHLRPDGPVRLCHLVSSAVRDAAWRPVRTVAILRDATERRAAGERQRLLAHEVDHHRAKNALAVVQAALRLAPKEDAASYAGAIEGRVRALARAHTLLAEGRWTGADLRTLTEGELAPFLPPEGPVVPGGGAAPPGAAPCWAAPRCGWGPTRRRPCPWRCTSSPPTR